MGWRVERNGKENFTYLAILCALFGMDGEKATPSKVVGDLQIADKKVILNHLVHYVFFIQHVFFC